MARRSKPGISADTIDDSNDDADDADNSDDDSKDDSNSHRRGSDQTRAPGTSLKALGPKPTRRTTARQR